MNGRWYACIHVVASLLAHDRCQRGRRRDEHPHDHQAVHVNDLPDSSVTALYRIAPGLVGDCDCNVPHGFTPMKRPARDPPLFADQKHGRTGYD